MPVNAKSMVKVFDRPKSLTDVQFTYCPGCHHGLVTRIIAHTIDELGLQERTVVVAPVGCSVSMYEWFHFDGICLCINTCTDGHRRAHKSPGRGDCDGFDQG